MGFKFSSLCAILYIKKKKIKQTNFKTLNHFLFLNIIFYFFKKFDLIWFYRIKDFQNIAQVCAM